MSCGDYQVYIAERGGSRLKCGLPRITSIRFRRVLNEFSDADVEVAYGGCHECMTDVNPWQHELLIFRSGVQVWCGPIMNITYSPSSDKIKINARDLMAWAEKRRIEIEEDYEVFDTDVKDIFEWVLSHGYDKDPWGMSWIISETGIPMDKFYPGRYEDRWGGTYPRVADELRTLANIGIDFTVVNRTLYGGDIEVKPPTTEVIYLTDSSWAVVPDVLISGTAMSTRTIVAGGLGGFYGWYADQLWVVEESDSDYGLLETFTNDSDTDAYTDELPNPITQFAEGKHAALKQPLAFIEGGQLSRNASVDFNDIIPGVRAKVGIVENVRDIEVDYRIGSLTVQVNAESEVVDIGLIIPGLNEVIGD